MDCDADDAEWEQEQPDERVGYQRQQGQGPANDEEDAPEDESKHRKPPCLSNQGYGGDGRKVP